MYALGIDTTGPTLILGLSNFTTVSRYRSWDLGRTLSTHLQAHLADFMPPQHWSELQWLAVANGPGSFMGTRIGVVTARTLAQQLQVPLFALSALAINAWAETHRLDAAGEPIPAIAVEMPGPQGFVYGGIYRITRPPLKLNVLVPDQKVAIEHWHHLLQQQQTVMHNRVNLTGNGINARDIAQALLALGQQQWLQGDRPRWHEALPFYG